MRNVSAIFGALDHGSVPLDEMPELLDQSTKIFSSIRWQTGPP